MAKSDFEEETGGANITAYMKKVDSPCEHPHQAKSREIGAPTVHRNRWLDLFLSSFYRLISCRQESVPFKLIWIARASLTFWWFRKIHKDWRAPLSIYNWMTLEIKDVFFSNPFMLITLLIILPKCLASKETACNSLWWANKRDKTRRIGNTWKKNTIKK